MDGRINFKETAETYPRQHKKIHKKTKVNPQRTKGSSSHANAYQEMIVYTVINKKNMLILSNELINDLISHNLLKINFITISYSNLNLLLFINSFSMNYKNNQLNF